MQAVVRDAGDVCHGFALAALDQGVVGKGAIGVVVDVEADRAELAGVGEEDAGRAMPGEACGVGGDVDGEGTVAAAMYAAGGLRLHESPKRERRKTTRRYKMTRQR